MFIFRETGEKPEKASSAKLNPKITINKSTLQRSESGFRSSKDALASSSSDEEASPLYKNFVRVSSAGLPNISKTMLGY